MSSEPDPSIPEPRGALVPPVRRPPTAVGAATPPPPLPSRPVRTVRREPPWLVRAIGRALTAALDAADEVGDTIREALGRAAPRP